VTRASAIREAQSFIFIRIRRCFYRVKRIERSDNGRISRSCQYRAVSRRSSVFARFLRRSCARFAFEQKERRGYRDAEASPTEVAGCVKRNVAGRPASRARLSACVLACMRAREKKERKGKADLGSQPPTKTTAVLFLPFRFRVPFCPVPHAFVSLSLSLSLSLSVNCSQCYICFRNVSFAS